MFGVCDKPKSDFALLCGVGEILKQEIELSAQVGMRGQGGNSMSSLKKSLFGWILH